VKRPEDIDSELEVGDALWRNQKVTLTLSIILLLLVIGSNVQIASALINRFPLREFVYTQNAAAVCTFSPIDEPGFVSDASVKNYAATIAVDLNTLDFANWRSDINRVVNASFTQEARTSYLAALKDSQILQAVLRQRYALTAIVRDESPVSIMSQGIVDGRYQWRVLVPITVSYATDKDFRPENRDLEIVLVRAPVASNNHYGVLVDGVFSTQTLAPDQERQQPNIEPAKPDQ
jgi:intracellular multiplication protein IcmL